MIEFRHFSQQYQNITYTINPQNEEKKKQNSIPIYCFLSLEYKMRAVKLKFIIKEF